MSNFIDKLKTNWATVTFVVTMITTAVGAYNKIDSYIEKRVDASINKHITAHKKQVKIERDSIVKTINDKFFIPVTDDVTRHEFFLDKVIQGLHAEFDPFVYRGITLYKSNPNAVGYVQTWYILKRDMHWEIYKCTYNATHDCYEYFDLTKKRIIFLKKD